MSVLVLGILLLATSSYVVRTPRLSVGITPGNLTPDITLRNDSGEELSLSAMKGQKVLINFWASYDADSHMKNVLLWNYLQKENHQIKMVSVSFDKNKSVFQKTLQFDGIRGDYQYFESDGSKSKAYQKYRLEKGFSNYLINEEGVIIAVNLMPKDLNRLLAEN